MGIRCKLSLVMLPICKCFDLLTIFTTVALATELGKGESGPLTGYDLLKSPNLHSI